MAIERETFAAAYSTLCSRIITTPEYEVGPRGMQTRELRNAQIVVENPLSNLFWTEHRHPDERYLAGELLWYFIGSNNVEDIKPYSKFWDKLVNPDGKTVNSAYGNLIFRDSFGPSGSEWAWAFTKLIQDKDTRQSIIRFNKPQHSFEGNKDFVCTLTGIFHIRENKLFLTINMRSSDMWFGLTYDFPFFSLLLQQMRLHLLQYYPTLGIGTLTMNLASAHIYERCYEDVKKMLEETVEERKLPQMKESFIMPRGHYRNEFCYMYNAIKNDKEILTPKDELYRWIYEQARNKN